ncbi:Antibiotic biosynthesis monooxygenase [Actinobacteria bacterium OK074]|nr:Antibiotic biosynthesis monooxygenase [Actinobacteria bacterium OK074]
MSDDSEGASQAVSLTRFTRTGSEPEFKRAFDTFAEHTRALPGFRQFQAVGSVLSPDVYVCVGWWGDSASCHAGVAGDGWQEVLRALDGVAAADLRVAGKVANGLRIHTADDAGQEEVEGYSDERLVVITSYAPADDSFTALFTEHTKLRRTRPGFVFHEGVREESPSLVHHNIEWWLDAEAYRAARAAAAVRESAAELAGIADVTTLRARNFANGAPIS